MPLSTSILLGLAKDFKVLAQIYINLVHAFLTDHSKFLHDSIGCNHQILQPASLFHILGKQDHVCSRVLDMQGDPQNWTTQNINSETTKYIEDNKNNKLYNIIHT